MSFLVRNLFHAFVVESSGGTFNIQSILGEGTIVETTFEGNNIDRAPLGNMGDTMLVIINVLGSCELIYTHRVNDEEFVLSTVQIKEILEVEDINSNDVLLWVKEYVNESLNELYDKL